MKIIPRPIHGVLDYVVGIILILSPRLFGFNSGGAEQSVPVALGWTTLVYSLLTKYELGALRMIPFRAHLVLDFLSGLFLAVSPWLLGFANRVWVPHVILGLLEIVVVALSRRDPAIKPATTPAAINRNPA
jgi:hypothetical protein